MVGIVIVTHGKFATEILKSAELILGEQKDVITLGLEHGDSVEALSQDVNNAIQKLDKGKGVLVLTDLFGGSPSNVTFTNMKELKFQSLTGVNLPMLLEALALRTFCQLDELTAKCMEAGVSGIKELHKMFATIEN